jgi:hypothetical protein
MRKTKFTTLTARKQFLYEQKVRSYRRQDPLPPAAWTPFGKKLLDSKITLISVAGAYLDAQTPFTAEGKGSDFQYRELSLNIKPEELKFFALDWESSETSVDFNTVLPVERIILLQKEGLIGKVDDTIYSFSGYHCNPALINKSVKEKIAEEKNNEWVLLKKNLKAMISKLKDNESDGALLIPASCETSETASLIAREVEAAGISTVVLSLFYEQALVLNPPRCAFINFPFGRTLGKANHIALHTAILRDTLRLFEKSKTPGDIINLNFIWSHGEIPDW